MQAMTGHDVLTRWLDSLPPTGWKGTSTELRANLAAVAQPGDVMPGPRSTVRRLTGLLAASKYRLRHDRKTAARWIVIEPNAAGETAN